MAKWRHAELEIEDRKEENLLCMSSTPELPITGTLNYREANWENE